MPFSQNVRSFLPLAFIGVVMLSVVSNLHWNQRAAPSILEADARGYYAYLPAIFIHHDLNYGFFEELDADRYFNPNLHYDYRLTVYGKKVNKYFCGTAILQLPFFLLAHAYVTISGGVADGYSPPYLYAITVAGIFYLLLGLWFFDRLLKQFEAGVFGRTVTLLAITFGTNLFYYAAVEPGMSHVYSFALVAAFLNTAKASMRSAEPKAMFFMALLLGLIGLVRPVNVLIIGALPLVSNSWSAFITWLRWLFSKPIQLIASILTFGAVVSVQSVIYWISTGSGWIYTYAEEGFNFLEPHMIDMLISYKKGLFLYTPMFFLAVLSAIWVWKKSTFRLLSYVSFFVALTFVLSSWWNWWYGGSFSSRVFVEFIPVLFIPLAVLLNRIGQMERYVAVSVLFLVVLVCQLQIYQYRYYIIHWENMDKELYWDRFLDLRH